jgi:hypothetical protein
LPNLPPRPKILVSAIDAISAVKFKAPIASGLVFCLKVTATFDVRIEDLPSFETGKASRGTVA